MPNGTNATGEDGCWGAGGQLTSRAGRRGLASTPRAVAPITPRILPCLWAQADVKAEDEAREARASEDMGSAKAKDDDEAGSVISDVFSADSEPASADGACPEPELELPLVLGPYRVTKTCVVRSLAGKRPPEGHTLDEFNPKCGILEEGEEVDVLEIRPVEFPPPSSGSFPHILSTLVLWSARARALTSCLCVHRVYTAARASTPHVCLRA